MVQIVQILQNEKIINIFNIVVWVWFIYFILLLIYLYIKSFRPYKTDFNEEFYTSIPSDLNIIEVSNLVNRKLNGNVLAAYIINLIRIGHLKIEIIDGKEYLVRNYSSCKPSIGDEATIKLVLYTMGDGNKVTIDDLYHFCDRKRNKNIMLMEYEIWCKVMKKENYKHIFYETKEEYGIVKFTSFLGCLIFLVDIILGFNNNLGYCTLLPAILLLFLFSISCLVLMTPISFLPFFVILCKLHNFPSISRSGISKLPNLSIFKSLAVMFLFIRYW